MSQVGRRSLARLLRMDGVAPAAQAEARAILARQVDQVVRLVDDLVEVSRITTGKLQLRPERVDLRRVAEAAIEAVEPRSCAPVATGWCSTCPRPE